MLMRHDMLPNKEDPHRKKYYAFGPPGLKKLYWKLPKDIFICNWYYGQLTDKKKSAFRMLLFPGDRYTRSRRFHPHRRRRKTLLSSPDYLAPKPRF